MKKFLITLFFIFIARCAYSQGLDANTVLLMSGDNDHETDASTKDGSLEIMDSAGRHIITQVGDTTIQTSVVKLGSGALTFDGTTDYITIPDSVDFQLGGGTGDFSYGGWIYFDSVSSLVRLYTQRPSAGNTVQMYWSTSNIFYMYADESSTRLISISAPWTPVVDTWYHWALVRSCSSDSSDCWDFYVDGAPVTVTKSDGNWNATMPNLTGSIYIGAYSDGTASMEGKLDELFLSNSALWTADFSATLTASTSIVNDANAKLIIHADSQDRSGDGGSGTYHIPTFEGDAQVDTAQKEFGAGSYVFDGTGDYISIPDSTDWNFFGSNSDSKTIDCWVYTSLPADSGNLAGQEEDANNYWLFQVLSTGMVAAWAYDEGFIISQILTPVSSCPANTWTHLALVKIASEYAIYVNGVQKAYVSDSDVLVDFAAPMIIGVRPVYSEYYVGNIDEYRWQNSNAFSAAPNVGKTNTFTPPTEAYSVDAGRNRQIFISKFIKKDTGEYDRCKDIRSEEDCMEIHHYIHNGA